MRLTENIEYHHLQYADPYYQGISVVDVFNKLKRYEDYEDALKIDLDILLKSFGGVFYIKNNKIKFSCHLALVDWRFYVLDEGPVSAKKGFALELIDYGRKWSLYKRDLFVLPSDEPTYLSYPRDNKGRFIKRS